ncbi:type IX secretion system membrane protein PorP/SprF [Prolixibacteraceae bacterium Z1-6]|uniref:Type IX secretion system membrane protein PorP/SprF n=1 Tax=Draconibacterium aestuarii TaxID=2998507 RepID=A0A9X3J6F7_9BACT|nr:type IX secretion system membrane protein PorP/SprF [Prolixibacteraceae bacterium Z1-6]
MKTTKNKKQNVSLKSCVLWIILILVSTTGEIRAQQEPTYTQYMFNTQTINPAYAGTWNAFGVMLLAREQWVGVDGAPSTQTLSFQNLLKNQKTGYGVNIINDKFGKEKRLSVYGDYSHLVQMTTKLNLRLGLKAGFSAYSNNLGNYQVINDDDPFFQGEVDYKFMPNFGIGLFLYQDNFYAGLSVPKIVKNEFENNYNNYSSQAELRHFYLTGGYIFNLSENFIFKPTALGKFVQGAPAQVDLSGNFLIKNRVWLGVMYRSGDAFGFLGQWIINNKLRLGYSVDFSTNKIRSYQNGTHEVMISYEISKIKEEVINRYF